MQGVITAWETLGLEIGVIAEQFELEADEIRAILFEGSAKYREEVAGKGAADDELVRLYENLAKYSKVDSVRERALRWLMNERKGRNDLEERALKIKERQAKVGEVDLSLRIAQFNETLRRNREILQECLKS